MRKILACVLMSLLAGCGGSSETETIRNLTSEGASTGTVRVPPADGKTAAGTPAVVTLSSANGDSRQGVVVSRNGKEGRAATLAASSSSTPQSKDEIGDLARSLPKELMGTFARSMACAGGKPDVEKAKLIASEVQRTGSVVGC